MYSYPEQTYTNGCCPSCNASHSPEKEPVDDDEVIDHPDHYTWHPIAECRQIAQEFPYNIGTAIAYLWRYPRKNGIEDLRKARKHIDFEIDRLESQDQ